MTTYSRSDLATRIGRDLGVIGAEETPSAADLAWLEETVSSEVAMLGVVGMPIWNGSDMEIPQEYLTPLSRRIGLAVAASFGLTDLATAELAMERAENVLAKMAAPHAGRPLTLRTDDVKRGSARFNFSSGQSY